MGRSLFQTLGFRSAFLVLGRRSATKSRPQGLSGTAKQLVAIVVNLAGRCLKDQQHVLLAFVGYSSRSLFFFLDLHVHSYLDEGDIKTNDVQALSTSSCPTFGYLYRLHSHLPDSPEPRIYFDMLPTLRRSSIFCGDFQDKTLKSKAPKPSKTQESSNPKNLNPGNLKLLFFTAKKKPS